MIFHDRDINNEQHKICNQNDTVCKSIVADSILNARVYRYQYLAHFLAVSRYICINFSVSENFLVLDVKQPKILMFDVIEGKILVFSVFEIPPSRPSINLNSGANLFIDVLLKGAFNTGSKGY